MTVLRSREISSTATSKISQPLVPENVVVEPVTPSKTFEVLSQSSNCDTPISSSPIQNYGNLELGLGSTDIMVTETGTVRRSARLAKKGVISNWLENVEFGSRKRKKVEGSSFNDKLDATNLESRVLDLQFGVENSCGVPDVSITGLHPLDLGDGKVTGDVNDGGGLAKLGFGYDTEPPKVETVNHGRRKRKFSTKVELGDSESPEKEAARKFLSLRSGKRVAKRGTEEDDGHVGNSLAGTENSKDSSVRVPAGTRSEASIEEYENGSRKGRRLSAREKGKGKVSYVMNGSGNVNSKLDGVVGSSPGDSTHDAINLPKSPDSIEVAKDKGYIIIEADVKTRRRLSKKEKGKMKLEVKDSSSNGFNTAELTIQHGNGSVSGSLHSAANESLPDGVQAREADAIVNDARRGHMERHRNFARRNALRFAHFSSREELGDHADVARREIPLPDADSGLEDWPGPFSTAIKIIKDGKRCGASTDKSEAVELKWIPKLQDLSKRQKLVPSLQELCLSILAKNSEAITSLDFVPDALRHKICWFLCDNRRMNHHFLELLVHGYPTEIRIRDCSWLSEELFAKIFEGCDASKLMVMQFDQCGSCMPDYNLHATLARSPNCLPALTTISLKGAYRLSDAGLNMLVSAAPSLKSIDISQCPLLTSEGICCLADSLRLVLREVYLDNCHGIDAMSILLALLKLENLEVLSLAGIQTVCDDFISEFISIHGGRMKELVLADCLELTDSSFKVIGDTCSELRSIDMSNLCKLTDVSIGHLANGCQAVQMLKFCRNAFSDEAIAAYLDVRGASLKDLSLNNIIKVSNHTALSLARNCRSLRSLDLSWCRSLTNEALGLVADSCSSLEVLKLFGCTQVTNVFLDGHSNPELKLIGLKMTQVFKHIDVPDFLLGPLRYSSIST